MTKLDKERRIEVTDQIEQLLATNCRRCPVQRSGANWGVKCKPAPVCPVMIELQDLGKELGFPKISREKYPIDPQLLQQAKANGIPEHIYIFRVKNSQDPVEATQIPYLGKRGDQDFLRLALSRKIPRSTYGSRVNNGWTPAEAASYTQGAKLKDIREGRANGLYII